MGAAHIICTVTNDLTYDQRMQRICSSLVAAGYQVTLVGRQKLDSKPIDHQPFNQVRLPVRAQRGKLFYWQFNKALYRWLKQEVLTHPGTRYALCAIDLDTIVPCYLVSKSFNLPRVYDAHELFTELTEVKRRPWIAALWKWIERKMVPNFPKGYTVNQFLANEFHKRYRVNYEVIRNLPLPATGQALSEPLPQLPAKFFLYQGAVNEGRAFDQLIPALQDVSLPLVIAGDGNYLSAVKELVRRNGLIEKVLFLGAIRPTVLSQITPKALAGITLFDNSGLNQYYSLANRFFDYVQAGIPQICVAYPEYKALNEQFEVALLLPEPGAMAISEALNKLAGNPVLYQHLSGQARLAARQWNWEMESAKLIDFWNKNFPAY